jgi:hypothetical protein
MADVDYHSAHRAHIEAQKSSPLELNLGWTGQRQEGSIHRAHRSRR